MAVTKKIPVRMCSGCMEHRPKKDMLRVVRTPEGEIKLDKTGKCSGRGVYICHSVGCLKLAQKARRLERALGARIPDEVAKVLEGELNAEG